MPVPLATSRAPNWRQTRDNRRIEARYRKYRAKSALREIVAMFERLATRPSRRQRVPHRAVAQCFAACALNAVPVERLYRLFEAYGAYPLQYFVQTGDVPRLRAWFDCLCPGPAKRAGWVCSVVHYIADAEHMRPVLEFAREVLLERFGPEVPDWLETLVSVPGATETLRWLYSLHPAAFARDSDTLHYAMLSGDIKMVDWMHSIGYRVDSTVWHDLAYWGRVPPAMLEWTLRHEDIPADADEVVAIAFNGYNEHMLELLRARRPAALRPDFYLSCAIWRFDAVRWLWRHFPLTASQHWRAILVSILEGGDLEGLRWLRRQSPALLPPADMLRVMRRSCYPPDAWGDPQVLDCCPRHRRMERWIRHTLTW